MGYVRAADTIDLVVGDAGGLEWAQQQVAAHHYLRTRVDTRCRPLALIVTYRGERAGCLIWGRPEATRCYDGGLTYGSQADVAAGRAQFDRWEVIALARVWLDPRLQAGGAWCRPGEVPGYTDRRGAFRSTLATSLLSIGSLLITQAYLLRYPPCYLDEPYLLRAALSYCDTRVHRGTIYRAAEWQRARVNDDSIETWWRPLPATPEPWDADIRRAAEQSLRSRTYRARRAADATQERMPL